MQPERVTLHVASFGYPYHSLLQGSNSLEWFTLPSQLPVLLQLSFVELIPLHDKSLSPPGKFASHRTVRNADRDLVSSIRRVEVTRFMITVVNRDDDAKKPTNLRHNLFYRSSWAPASA